MVHSSSSSSSSSFRRDLLRLRRDPLCSIVDWPQCHFVRFVRLRSRSVPFVFSTRRDETRRERATRHATYRIIPKLILVRKRKAGNPKSCAAARHKPTRCGGHSRRTACKFSEISLGYSGILTSCAAVPRNLRGCAVNVELPRST